MADAYQLKAILSANATSLLGALKTVNLASRTTRKYLSDVVKSAGNLGGKLALPTAAVSGALGGLSLVGIKNAVVGFGELGEAIFKGSNRAGMSVEQYQKMKYVAEMAGVGVETLEGAMGQLNRRMGDVSGGKNKNVESLFKRLGITMRDANGHLKSGVDILPQLADAFQRNEDHVVRSRMGMALFGKKWQEIIPLLVEGGEGIRESMERMDRFKGVMPKDQIDVARQFARSMRDVDFIMKGFSMTIGKELAPVIKPLIDDFAVWAAANKKVVATKIAEMVKDLGAWIKSIDFKELAKQVKGCADVLGWFVDQVGGAKNALIALVLYMNKDTIKALVGLIESLGRLIWRLGVMALEAVPSAVAALKALGKEMGTAGTKANGLLGTLGKIGQVAGAGMLGYETGTLINDYIINPATERLTGEKGQTLGGWIYDKTHTDGADRPSLVKPLSQQSGGKFTFDFVNAPPGMRLVNQETRGGTDVDMNMGYRYTATGMP